MPMRRSELLSQFREGRSLMLTDQRLDNLIEVTFENFGQTLNRQIYPMIGHTALREVIRSNSFRAITGAHQRFARLRSFSVTLCLLGIGKPRLQQ